MTPLPARNTHDPRLYRGWATVDGDWDRFYKEFPGVYDRFAISTPLVVDEMRRVTDFAGARVLSLASGTGKDVFEIATEAAHVVGLEPWVEMRSFAIAKQQRLGVRNVEFVDGIAEDLSRFGTGSFDRLISLFGAPFPWDDAAFVRGCLRVVRPGGYVLFGGNAGVTTAPRGATAPGSSSWLSAWRQLLAPFGFSERIQPATFRYGSIEEALATWGFIYGEPAIDYLLGDPSHTLSVDLVIHFTKVG